MDFACSDFINYTNTNMTQEEKDLLVKDLCARLPYHPKINIYNDSWEGCQIGEFDNELWCHHIEAFKCDRIEIKPYLRPLSSMTEVEKGEIQLISDNYLDAWESAKKPIERWKADAKVSSRRAEFYNSHHFDWNGLIEKGLALEAPKDMYKEN